MNITTNLSTRVTEWRDGMDRHMNWGQSSECRMWAVVEIQDNQGIFAFAFIGCVNPCMYPVEFHDKVNMSAGIFPTYAEAMNYAMGCAFRYARP
jgi:hypothetical protein